MGEGRREGGGVELSCYGEEGESNGRRRLDPYVL